MLTKSQLKDIFAKYPFHPLKRLGENYLIDANIKDKMIRSAHVTKADIILEIGPGLGALTMDLARSGAKVYAVEKDLKAFSALRDLVGSGFTNLRLVNEDILKFDLKKIYDKRRIKVIGNLPYYITTPIIEYLIDNRSLIESALITVQREVANRLLAPPGSKDYGAITCFVQYYAKAAYIYTIKRASFFPMPEVDSSLMKFDILDKPPVEVSSEELFFKIIRGAFNQRRKVLLNSLARDEVLGIPKEKLARILNDIGMDPNARPESLNLSAFAAIANSLAKEK